MKELFLISGLGADQRVFEFLDLSGYKLNYVDWIHPLPDESIEQYAQRLLKQIPVEKPILIGVSFGGIVAIEIGKLIPTEKIIQVSSAEVRSAIPWYFRLAGKLQFHKLLQGSIRPPARLLYYFFGVKEPYEKELLLKIIRETDPAFLKWAIDKIVHWENTTLLPNVTIIHGNKDNIFPNQMTNNLILDGGHFMIVNMADVISRTIRGILSK